jgi:hypothetical protein
MRNLRLNLVSAGLITLMWAPSFAGPIRLECPPELHVAEQAQMPAPWKPFRKSGDHAFQAVALFDGPPSHDVRLTPQPGETSEAEVWTLSPPDSPYVVCEYLNAQTVLMQPVGRTVAKCRSEKAGKTKAVICE